MKVPSVDIVLKAFIASDMNVPSFDTVSPLKPGVGLNIASDMKVPSVDTVFPLKPGVGLNIAFRHEGPLCRHRLPFKAWCRSEYCIQT